MNKSVHDISKCSKFFVSGKNYPIKWRYRHALVTFPFLGPCRRISTINAKEHAEFAEQADEDENEEIDVISESSNDQQTLHVQSAQEKELIDYLGEGSQNKPFVRIVRLPVQTLGNNTKSTIQIKTKSNTDNNYELKPVDYSPYLSRNAINARENRRKKKAYLKNLETQNAKLLEENEALKRHTLISDKKIQTLNSELEYFKGIIANQSTLSKILGTVRNIPGLRFQSSFSLDNAKQSENDETESMNARKSRRKLGNKDSNPNSGTSWSKRRKVHVENDDEENAENVALVDHNDNREPSCGVCLHVSGNSVSLEFCEKCSSKASVASSHSVKDHTYGRSISGKRVPEERFQNVG
ncbi:hypothetical protein FSP39_018944 [Pinctada imbricata]|uniref:BZIP domain-containing protein n=1 Tax=Pinctada imbricata TaxID=66713 RepID=A0AA88YCA1_PINIB|nr:hypothetical protein FSP39_018944 [Pinctada imbricata]